MNTYMNHSIILLTILLTTFPLRGESRLIHYYECNDSQLVAKLEQIKNSSQDIQYGVITVLRKHYLPYSQIDVQFYSKKDSFFEKDLYGIIQLDNIRMYLCGEKDTDLFRQEDLTIQLTKQEDTHQSRSVLDYISVLNDSNMYVFFFDKVCVYTTGLSGIRETISGPIVRNDDPYTITDYRNRKIFTTRFIQEGCVVKKTCIYYNKKTTTATLTKSISLKQLSTVNTSPLDQAGIYLNSYIAYVYYDNINNNCQVRPVGTISRKQAMAIKKWIKSNIHVIIPTQSLSSPMIFPIYY